MVCKYIIPLVINSVTNRADYDELIGRIHTVLHRYKGKIKVGHVFPVYIGGRAIHPGMDIEICFGSPRMLHSFLGSDDFTAIEASAADGIISRAYVINEDRFNCSRVTMSHAG